jgi:hypothetical protein
MIKSYRGQLKGLMRNPDRASVGFVTCVEAGPLELMTVRLVESLRLFGGRLSRSSFYVVKPRNGPSLDFATLEAFGRLDVRFFDVPRDGSYCWDAMSNKPWALSCVEKTSREDIIAWVDTDAIVMGEPLELLPDISFDLSVSELDVDIIGSRGPGDENENFWNEASRAAGLELASLPWMRVILKGYRVRMYVQAGVFAYWRDTDFGQRYQEMCRSLFDARVGHRRSGTHWLEQMSVGFAILKHRLRFKELPRICNYGISSDLSRIEPNPVLSNVKILHYHDMMKPINWPSFIHLLERNTPNVYRWIHEKGAIKDPRNFRKRTHSRALHYTRALARRCHHLNCNMYCF